MSFQPNFPPSLIQRIKEDEGSDEKKKSKEDYRKMKELEEARKLAVMPAMKDEEGRDINPHIPQYIMQAPWYYGAMHPTLSHQRIQDEKKREEASGNLKGSTSLNQWYKRGTLDATKTATKYRDGACENCGSISHKRKDCMERPRKVGAKYSGTDIAPDDYEQFKLEMTFEAKRDRWNGYDPAEHKRLFVEYQRLEEAQKLAKAKKLEEKLAKAVEASDGQEEPAASAAKPTLDDDADLDMEDGDRYGDELDMPGQKFDSKQRQSIRNLRIREDTAKYLFNLDPNSAFYDPKTRAMRSNPFEHSGKPESEVPFAGDNFVRFDGDVYDMMRRQVFAWEMHDKLGLDVHLQADPTRLELLAKKVSKAKSDVQSRVREEILDRYGGHEHLTSVPQELMLGQWETYAEYSPTGRVIKGAETPTVQSCYEEDVFRNNHSSVWGSYWFNGQWGYKCCQSLIKESYCMGEKGKSTTGANSKVASLADTSCPQVPDGPVEMLKPPPMPVTDSRDSDDVPATVGKRVGRKRKTSAGSRSSSSSSSSSSRSSSSSSSKSRSPSKRSVVGELVDTDKQDESVVTEDLAKINAEKEVRLAEIAYSEARREKLRAQRAEKKKKKKQRRKISKRKRCSSSSSSSSEDEHQPISAETLQEQLIQEAITKEKARLKQVDALLEIDERKRPYNSLAPVEAPTAEQMEAFYRTRVNRDDPMSHFT